MFFIIFLGNNFAASAKALSLLFVSASEIRYSVINPPHFRAMSDR